MGLAWLLSNDATGNPRPGQGSNSTVSTAVIGVDLARNGLPKELLPDGVLSNLSAVSIILFSVYSLTLTIHKVLSCLPLQEGAFSATAFYLNTFLPAYSKCRPDSLTQSISSASLLKQASKQLGVWRGSTLHAAGYTRVGIL